MLKQILIILTVVYLFERLFKWLAVVLFFAKRTKSAASLEFERVSVLQPILSGDPTLAESLEANLKLASVVPAEFIWLIDDDDEVASELCRKFKDQYADVTITILTLPAGDVRESPKMLKLIKGLEVATGDVICVLDDDTRLPVDELPPCIDRLDEDGVGLVFGIPYYVSFSNLCSSLVGAFVNSHSLLTYVPYTFITSPFTINGMFYVTKREVLEKAGGFAGLETVLADDFAVAQRFRENGFKLIQTRLRHAISTHVESFSAYFRLLHRWLIFPRETVMKALPLRDLFVAYLLAFLPCLAPLVIVVLALSCGGSLGWSLIGTVFGVNFVIFLYFNFVYLQQATPWQRWWLVPLIQLVLPLQLAIAVLLPQRINWRGHQMQIERGGTFRMIQRRDARN